MTRIRRAATCQPLFAGARLERVKGSPRYRDGRFTNIAPVGAGLKGNPLPTLGEYFFSTQQRVPPTALVVADPRAVWQRQATQRLTWLGHSTMLLEMDGARVLTDPVFGLRASPLAFAGPKRFHPVPAQIADLPHLDAVLISHDHYDHLCYESVMALAKRDVPFVTSLGVGARLEAWGVPKERIFELDWWETWRAPKTELTLTATPSQHFSGRGLADRNLTLWSGWAVQTAKTRLFFSGDTGLCEEFGEIGRRLGPFDLVLLEIGAWHQSWGDIHLGPENALKVLQMLGGGALLPVHWGTFNLALHAWDEPAETLWNLAGQQGVRLLTPRLGVPIEPMLHDEPVAWWRDLARKA